MNGNNEIKIDFDMTTLSFNIIMIVAIIAVMWLLQRGNHLFFKKIQKERQGIHLKFFERVNSAIILFGGIIIAFSFWGGIGSVWQSILGGTAVVSAVLAFAAQDIIKDILAGLMISLYRPVEIGNRIELEDGTVGIVKDITMRHVVLLWKDTTYIVIPNSRFNSMKLINYSYHSAKRSASFTFNIAYDADVEKAKKVIKDAIISSDLSIPGLPGDNSEEYADVYFMSFEDSSLRLVTTAYYNAETRSEVFISDINTRVNEALRANGIEIPYAYINIIEKQNDREISKIRADRT